ncbi:MAG: hypothetical protein R3264_09395, partial [Anaerolineae bacterium]|nr:hypothetical protein [Anaerolineae bacterium]
MTNQLFISYRHSNQDAAHDLAQMLQARQVKVCRSADLPERLEDVRAIIMLIGASGLSQPQLHLLGRALSHQARMEHADDRFPVVPVLLPGASIGSAFLFTDHWIDARQGWETAVLETLAGLGRGCVEPIPRRPPAALVEYCPYRGSTPYREEDAPFFFGREAVIGQLCQAVNDQKYTTLLGVAHSGKTSVVQAGLIPRLRREVDPWQVITLRAGYELLNDDLTLPNQLELAAPSETKLLVVLDQVERLFSEVPPEMQTVFIDGLFATIEARPSVPLLMVIDQAWLGRAVSFNAGLQARLTQNIVHLPPPDRSALAQIIDGPARLVNTACEPALRNRLRDETASLPQLSFALQSLWHQRQAGLMTDDSYQSLGGPAGVLDRQAEAIFATLTTEQRRRLRLICLHLVPVTPGEHQPWVDLTDLTQFGNEKRVQAILQPFLDKGLLVIRAARGGQTQWISFSYQLLPRYWRRLQQWQAEEQEFLLWRQRTAGEVEKNGLSHLPGSALDEARRWQQARRRVLTEAEQALIDRSLTRRNRLRFTRWAIASGVALLIVALFGVIVGLQNRTIRHIAAERTAAQTAQAQAHQAQQLALGQRAIAEADRLVAEEQRQAAVAGQLAYLAQAMVTEVGDDLVTGTLLALESLRRAPSLAAEQALRQGITRLPRPVSQLPHQAAVVESIFSSDGRWLATRSGSTVYVWDGITGAPVTQMPHLGPVSSMSFSPDGYWLVTASQNQTVQVWQVSSGREVGRLRHGTPISEVRFSPNGQQLLSIGENVAYVWGLADNPVGKLILTTSSRTVADADISQAVLRLNKAEPPPETRHAVIGQGVVRMLHDAVIETMVISPDGRWLVTAGVDGLAQLWDIQAGRALARMPHPGAVSSLIFSHDGQLLVTGGSDHKARIWYLGET